MKRVKFAPSLVAVIALVAVVAGVVAGRATSGSTGGGGGGAGGAASGKRIDVIVKATDSSFWQSVFAGSAKAGTDFGLQVDNFGPTSETDVDQQVQLVENSISRGVHAIVLAPNSSTALNNAVDRARKAGIKVIIIDTPITTASDGFIGTNNVKAAQQAGEEFCQRMRRAGKDTGNVLVEAAVAGVQVMEDRTRGFASGLAACPNLKIVGPRYNNNDINTAASQVNDAITADPALVGVFAANNSSGVGAARAIKDNNAAERLPLFAFDSDAQEVAALAEGTIDALVVQKPYFFGYQGVLQAGMAVVGSSPPSYLDPGAVLADKSNMDTPEMRTLLNPPTAKATK